jgi:heme/copper-type cytochrome/quinol oxidase subunit 1
MTPLRSTLAALAVGLVLTGALAAVAPAGGSPRAAVDCDTAGWTAYAPLDEEQAREAILAYIEQCIYGAPPPGWPPGAQDPRGHQEIQIIW